MVVCFCKQFRGIFTDNYLKWVVVLDGCLEPIQFSLFPVSPKFTICYISLANERRDFKLFPPNSSNKRKMAFKSLIIEMETVYVVLEHLNRKFITIEIEDVVAYFNYAIRETATLIDCLWLTCLKSHINSIIVYKIVLKTSLLFNWHRIPVISKNYSDFKGTPILFPRSRLKPKNVSMLKSHPNDIN